MTGIIHFETFLLAGIVLNLTPGNDTLFILSRSIALGKKAGIMSVLGIATGSVIHTTLAALGLSVIIAKSILAFTILKYAGAVYLLYIGYKMISGAGPLHTESSKSEALKPGKVFREGVITNVLNPKVALFFISFLPQFINPQYKNTILPFMLLGICFTITGTMWCLVLANFASAISRTIKKKPRVAAHIKKTCGAVLIALGLKLALTGRK